MKSISNSIIEKKFFFANLRNFRGEDEQHRIYENEYDSSHKIHYKRYNLQENIL